MYKTVIALAIAGLAAAPAFADSNVTIYGSVDYAFGARSGSSGLRSNCPSATPGPGCGKQEFASGVSVPNRLGFKGSEDLGNGTKAIFELEAGFLADDGTNSIPGGNTTTNGPVFRRHSWVGLTGEWGTVLGGRVDGARYGVATNTIRSTRAVWPTWVRCRFTQRAPTMRSHTSRRTTRVCLRSLPTPVA
jgi:predicted porin